MDPLSRIIPREDIKNIDFNWYEGRFEIEIRHKVGRIEFTFTA